MNKKLKIFSIIILIVFAIIIVFGACYLNDYYHAEDEISNYLNGTDNVTVVKTEHGLFLNGSGEENVLIFYPGAKVEYTSYLPLLMNLSNSGVDCYLVEMPFNIAFLGKDYADDIVNNNSFSYENYYLCGHSLGGVVASSYAGENDDKVKGLILLASYPTDTTNVPVLSIYGSKDSVLNHEKYEESEKLMNNFTEYVIEGGNHAQYAFYGNQDKDTAADISRDEQVRITVNKIMDFINNS